MNDPVEYLDLDDLIDLARLLLGDPPIRDVGLLGSAAARPQAFGDGAALVETLERGPQTELPTDNLSHDLYAVPAEAALRACEYLDRSPSSEWMAQARAVLASYRGRPPKAERAIFEDLEARVEAANRRP